MHFRWVLERCLTPHSYVPASAQEALLQVFLSERVASGAQPAPPVVPLQPAALTVPDQPLLAPERDSPALVAPPAPSPRAASQPARLPCRCFPEEDVGSGTPVPVAQPPAGTPPLGFPEEDVCLATPAPVAQPLAPHPRPPPPLTPWVALIEVRVSRPTRTQTLQRACHACRTWTGPQFVLPLPVLTRWCFFPRTFSRSPLVGSSSN